jgi:hypothetical protein
MSSDIELSADVIAEIETNRKVTAIKLLREQQGIGLKEAKEIVDAYQDEHPRDTTHQSRQSQSGIGRLLLVALMIGLAYGLFRYVS